LSFRVVIELGRGEPYFKIMELELIGESSGYQVGDLSATLRNAF
jgi:hypothetical protein